MNPENSVNAAGETSFRSEAADSDTGVDVSRTATCCEEMTGQGFKPMEMCPMSEMCKGIMEGKGMGSSWLLLVPGTLLVLGGLLVILVPEILVWLLGMTSIVLGVIFLLIANVIRKFFVGFGKHNG